MQRAGNRRYYRPADVDLARRINQLLNQEGYTVRGVQKLLREKGDAGASAPQLTPHLAAVAAAAKPAPSMELDHEESGVDVFRLIALRNRLADALDD